MKLLLDQNLPPRLCQDLADLFPEAVHVRELGLRDAPDSLIWSCAAESGFAIETKDGDFRQRSLLYGHPPNVVWVRAGNCSTKAIETLLRLRADQIREFLADEQKAFLSLG